MKEADSTSDPEREFRKRMEKFFSLVGYAISRWAYVDRSLFEFCCFALGTSEKKTAVVFYRSPSIGDHLAITDGLMAAAQLQDGYLEQWKRISGKIAKLLPFRNDISHNPPIQKAAMNVILTNDPLVPGHIENQRQWWAIETDSKKLLHRSKGTREISATETELLQHIRSVDDLENDMLDLRWSLLGPPAGVNPTIRKPYVPPNSSSDSPTRGSSAKPKPPRRSSQE